MGIQGAELLCVLHLEGANLRMLNCVSRQQSSVWKTQNNEDCETLVAVGSTDKERNYRELGK